MVEGKYDDSPEMIPEDIERDEELRKLTDKQYLIKRYATIRKSLPKTKFPPSDIDTMAIGMIMSENNQRLLKLLKFSRH